MPTSKNFRRETARLACAIDQSSHIQKSRGTNPPFFFLSSLLVLWLQRPIPRPRTIRISLKKKEVEPTHRPPETFIELHGSTLDSAPVQTVTTTPPSLQSPETSRPQPKLPSRRLQRSAYSSLALRKTVQDQFPIAFKPPVDCPHA